MEDNSLKPKHNIEEQKIGEKTILFDIDSFKFYELNETMSFIWDMLKKEKKKKEIARVLTKKFDVEYERAEKDVEKAIQEFRKKDIVKDKS